MTEDISLTMYIAVTIAFAGAVVTSTFIITVCMLIIMGNYTDKFATTISLKNLGQLADATNTSRTHALDGAGVFKCIQDPMGEFDTIDVTYIDPDGSEVTHWQIVTGDEEFLNLASDVFQYHTNCRFELSYNRDSHSGLINLSIVEVEVGKYDR